MRDFAHIQDVLADELKDLFSLRKHYAPDIQTVQGLLLALRRLELCTRAHGDLLRYALRTSFVCRMAQDLGFHVAESAIKYDQDDRNLREDIWAACAYQDAYCSAILGQTMNISDQYTHTLATSFYDKSSKHEGDQAMTDGHAHFCHAASMSCCLRLILRCFFGINPARAADLYDQASYVLSQIKWHQTRLDWLQASYREESYRTLQMMHNNNRLLFVMGLRTLLPDHDDASASLRAMLIKESGSLIHEACQTVEWCTPELLKSPEGHLSAILYAVSRALMVVVDALRDVRHGAMIGELMVNRLYSAVANANSLIQYLLKEKSWSSDWTQGHTMKAILTRLDQSDENSTVDEVESSAEQKVSAQPLEAAHNNGAKDANDWDMAINGEDYVNSALQSTDWDAFFAVYDQEFDWPPFDEFDTHW